MDVRAIKLAAPLTVPWPERPARTLTLHPLPDADVLAAELVAHAMPEGRARELTLCMHLLATSLRAEPDDVGQLRPAQLGFLVQQWRRCQAVAWPPELKLWSWLERSMADHPAVIADGKAAYQSQSVQDYFGQPAVRCTRGQLTYFLGLRTHYRNQHDGRTTIPSCRREADYEERLQWQLKTARSTT